jgi:hypothetical protein
MKKLVSCAHLSLLTKYFVCLLSYILMIEVIVICPAQNELHTDTAQTVLLFSLLTCDPDCVQITICCLIFRAKWNFSSSIQMQKMLLTN